LCAECLAIEEGTGRASPETPVAGGITWTAYLLPVCAGLRAWGNVIAGLGCLGGILYGALGIASATPVGGASLLYAPLLCGVGVSIVATGFWLRAWHHAAARALEALAAVAAGLRSGVDPESGAETFALPPPEPRGSFWW
jgi:hypothetical protein